MVSPIANGAGQVGKFAIPTEVVFHAARYLNSDARVRDGLATVCGRLPAARPKRRAGAERRHHWMGAEGAEDSSPPLLRPGSG